MGPVLIALSGVTVSGVPISLHNAIVGVGSDVGAELPRLAPYCRWWRTSLASFPPLAKRISFFLCGAPHVYDGDVASDSRAFYLQRSTPSSWARRLAAGVALISPCASSGAAWEPRPATRPIAPWAP